jgi:hypothetical protein
MELGTDLVVYLFFIHSYYYSVIIFLVFLHIVLVSIENKFLYLPNFFYSIIIILLNFLIVFYRYFKKSYKVCLLKFRIFLTLNEIKYQFFKW